MLKRIRLALIVAPVAALVLAAAAPSVHAQATPGFIQDFPGTTLGGFTSLSALSNPGTGGTLGAGDGYLRIFNAGVGNLGANSSLSSDFAGDYVLAGIDEIRLWVNDVGGDQALEIHLGIGHGLNMWQYNVGFLPPNGSWGEYVVPLTAPGNWTQVAGAPNTFANAIQNADRILIRHDLAPYVSSPNTIAGDVGVDRIQLVSSTTSAASTSWSRIKTLYR